MAKMLIYKTIAKGGKRGGRTMYCIRCGDPYTDRFSEDAIGVVCCHCTNGLADGVVVEKPKKNSVMRINHKELDEKVKRRRRK